MTNLQALREVRSSLASCVRVSLRRVYSLECMTTKDGKLYSFHLSKSYVFELWFPNESARSYAVYTSVNNGPLEWLDTYTSYAEAIDNAQLQ